MYSNVFFDIISNKRSFRINEAYKLKRTMTFSKPKDIVNLVVF